MLQLWKRTARRVADGTNSTRKKLLLIVAASIAGAVIITATPLGESLTLSGSMRQTDHPLGQAVLELQNGDQRAVAFAVHSPGLYLTAMHAATGNEPLWLKGPGSTPTQATLVHADEGLDIAVLRTSGAGAHAVMTLRPRDASTPEVGEELIIWTLVWGKTWQNDATAVGSPAPGMLLNARLHSGDSGAPVTNTDGQVVGMVTAKVTGIENTVLAAGSAQLFQVLNEHWGRR